MRTLCYLTKIRQHEIVSLSNAVATTEAARPKTKHLDNRVSFLIPYSVIVLLSNSHPELRTWAIWDARNLSELEKLDSTFRSSEMWWPMMGEFFKGVSLPPRRFSINLGQILSCCVPHYARPNPINFTHFARINMIGVPETEYAVALRRWEKYDQFQYLNHDCPLGLSIKDPASRIEFEPHSICKQDIEAISEDWEFVLDFLKTR